MDIQQHHPKGKYPGPVDKHGSSMYLFGPSWRLGQLWIDSRVMAYKNYDWST